MLAKKTVRNQLTIPKEIADRFPGVDYFEVHEDAGRIVLSPLSLSKADEVRERLAHYGIGESDVAQAVRWARRERPEPNG